MSFEEVFIHTSDHIKIQVWLIPGSLIRTTENTSRFTILFFPGNKGTLSKFLPAMAVLHDAGFNICMFSYRGFGLSDRKRPFEGGLRKDCQAVWNYLTQRQKSLPKKIILYGQSIGCGLAAWVAAQFNPAGLVLEGGFPSVGEAAKRAVPWLPVKQLTTEKFDTQSHIHNVHCPVLIAHSGKDEVIPLESGRILFSHAPDPKQFVLISGNHAEGLEKAETVFMNAIHDFIDNVLGRENNHPSSRKDNLA
jgi:pimeloyl-ACP methyl ester carboxylesterase